MRVRLGYGIFFSRSIPKGLSQDPKSQAVAAAPGQLAGTTEQIAARKYIWELYVWDQNLAFILQLLIAMEDCKSI